MSSLFAVLTNLPGASAAQKIEIERRFLQSLEAEYGDLGKVAAAYQQWLARSHAKAQVDIDTLRALLKWESAHAKASCAALAGWDGDTSEAFFILHLKAAR